MSPSLRIFHLFQEYLLRVQRGVVVDNTWTVTRRYNDFANLDTALRLSGYELPLPPKKMFGNMEREFIAERQQGLHVSAHRGFHRNFVVSPVSCETNIFYLIYNICMLYFYF